MQADVLTYQPDKPFDAIYEQTCLCALHPDHWVDYARQFRQWLKPQGSLWALFMQMLRPEPQRKCRSASLRLFALGIAALLRTR